MKFSIIHNFKLIAMDVDTFSFVFISLKRMCIENARPYKARLGVSVPHSLPDTNDARTTESGCGRQL